MPERASKRHNHVSDGVDELPDRARPEESATEGPGNEIPADDVSGEDVSDEDDRRALPQVAETATAPAESWMPAWWQLAGGLVVFGATGLGLAWLGGVVGVVLIVALIAAVIWLLFHWASWE